MAGRLLGLNQRRGGVAGESGEEVIQGGAGSGLDGAGEGEVGGVGGLPDDGWRAASWAWKSMSASRGNRVSWPGRQRPE